MRHADFAHRDRWNAQTKSSAATWAREAFKSEALVRSRFDSNREFKLTTSCPVTRPLMGSTLSAETDSRDKETTGSLKAYTDDVDGKLRTEIATSIHEADFKRDQLHGALKSALETQSRLSNDVSRLGNEQEAKHKEMHQVLQGQKEAFDARLTQELGRATPESDAKLDKNHFHLSRMQESLETRIRDELLRIESENCAKHCEASARHKKAAEAAETKAAASTPVALGTKKGPLQHSRARVLTKSPRSMLCQKLLLCWKNV